MQGCECVIVCCCVCGVWLCTCVRCCVCTCVFVRCRMPTLVNACARVLARACSCVYVRVTYNSRSMSSSSIDVITLDFMLMLGLVNAASRCCHFRRLQINGVGVIINLSGVMGV